MILRRADRLVVGDTVSPRPNFEFTVRQVNLEDGLRVTLGYTTLMTGMEWGPSSSIDHTLSLFIDDLIEVLPHRR